MSKPWAKNLKRNPRLHAPEVYISVKGTLHGTSDWWQGVHITPEWSLKSSQWWHSSMGQWRKGCSSGCCFRETLRGGFRECSGWTGEVSIQLKLCSWWDSSLTFHGAILWWPSNCKTEHNPSQATTSPIKNLNAPRVHPRTAQALEWHPLWLLSLP